ncbi:MAG: hypothetical protein MK081_05400 [Flavobacteriales bacterium]|nr:hypothetical protein [Flavobacteriales bacterium]
MRAILLFLCLAATVSIQAQQAISIEPLLVSRSSHQLAKIDDTKALAAGGWDGSEISASAEYYDVETEMWLEIAPMGTARTNFAMCGLNNGYVIAAGGWDGEDPASLASTEIYDFDNDTWMTGPDLTVGRSYVETTKLLDGRILFTGGFDGNNTMATCDIYDPVANTITAAAPMNFARNSHATVLLPDGRVLVAGGFNPSLDFQMDEAEIYDPFLDEWTVTGSLNIGRDNMEGVVNESGICAIVGGRVFNGNENLFEGLASAEIYEPFTGTWITVSLPQKHCYNHMLQFGNGAIYSVSGTDQTGDGVTTTYAPSMSFSLGISTNVETIDAAEDGDQRFRSASAQLSPDMWIIAGADDAGNGTAELWMEPSAVEDIIAPSVIAFPNPSIDRFVISGEGNYFWQMIDMNGRIALEGQGNVVDVTTLPAGNYQLTSTDNENPFRLSVQVIH